MQVLSLGPTSAQLPPLAGTSTTDLDLPLYPGQTLDPAVRYHPPGEDPVDYIVTSQVPPSTSSVTGHPSTMVPLVHPTPAIQRPVSSVFPPEPVQVPIQPDLAMQELASLRAEMASMQRDARERESNFQNLLESSLQRVTSSFKEEVAYLLGFGWSVNLKTDEF